MILEIWIVYHWAILVKGSKVGHSDRIAIIFIFLEPWMMGIFQGMALLNVEAGWLIRETGGKIEVYEDFDSLERAFLDD